METALHHRASGVHASVHAYRILSEDNEDRLSTAISQSESHQSGRDQPFTQGLSGWRAVKIVRAGPSGKMMASKPHNVLKEALLLQKAKHPNVIQLLDYAWSESVWEHQLSLPLLSITLRTLLDSSILFPNPSISNEDLPDLSRLSVSRPIDNLLIPEIIFKSISFQLLVALAQLHGLGIAHRDIKPENIMLDWDGTVVLIDFGTAWDDEGEDWGGEWKEDRENMCCEVGTGSYRAPELLFGPITYDPQAIDLWATGCVLAEFLIPPTKSTAEKIDPLDGSYDDLDMDEQSLSSTEERRTLFDCTYGDIGLAGSIFRILGTPTEKSWPSFFSLPDSSKIAFDYQSSKSLSDVLPTLSSIAKPHFTEEVSTSLLVLDPSKRISAATALDLALFKSGDVLIPEKLGQSSEYKTDHVGMRVVDILGGRRLEDLLDDLLLEGKRHWRNK